MANYIIHGKKWRDKVNGNTYNSVRIFSAETGELVKALPYEYGYGNQYYHRAIDSLVLATDREDVRAVYDICETGCTKRDVKEWGEGK